MQPARPLNAQKIVVSPGEALIGEDLVVQVSGMAPGQAFVVRSEMKDSKGNIWQAWAAYRAGASGSTDLDSRPPDLGSFHEKGSTGLLTSMDVAGPLHGKTRFALEGTQPLDVRLRLESGGKQLDEISHRMLLRPPGGAVIELSEGGLVGRLFLPAGNGPFPGVLVLGGSEGGLSSENVAGLLAGHGFAALALAYFGLPGLPSALDEIPLETFDRAMEWLLAQPAVRRRSLAVVGTSKGAEAALLVASQTTRVNAAVAFAPSSVAWSCLCPQPEHASWTRAGRAVPFVAPGADPLYAPPAGFPLRAAVHYAFRLGDARAAAAAAIAVEAIAGPVLLIAGSDDQLWPSAAMARQLRDRLARSARPFADVLLEYAGAGHLIGLPNLPGGSTLVGGGRLETGGSPEANVRASRAAWPKVLAFLQSAAAR